MDEIEIKVDRVEKIDVESGDVLAIFIKDAYLSEETRARIKKIFEDSFLPKIVKVHILNGDVVDLKVLRVV